VTPSIAICLAQYSDSHEIADMSRTLIEHGLPWTWRPGRVAREIAAPNKNVVVAKDQDRLVGFGIMEYLDEHAYLVLFAVRASTQRQGVGSAILHWLEASALVAGAQWVRVEARRSNVAGRCFYNEHGYHELNIEPRRYSGVEDGVVLQKWLRESSEA
jgi:ribosomal protein S18 acetylase RimI-like enzyme